MQDPLPYWFAEDKPKGQYSRKHQTRDAQDEARERYHNNRGPSARRRRAQLRLEAQEVEG